MRQYFAAKAAHQDMLVYFRMGDFYELFYEDARKAARLLDITLTQRGQSAAAVSAQVWQPPAAIAATPLPKPVTATGVQPVHESARRIGTHMPHPPSIHRMYALTCRLVSGCFGGAGAARV